MPRTSAKARRLALAARIARELFTGGTGGEGTRLLIVDETKPLSAPGFHLGGWNEHAVRGVIEAHLRPGQRRRTQ